nr:alcohol dehydrogenase catalytic domain-containing protein [uncultured Devosia sp.]
MTFTLPKTMRAVVMTAPKQPLEVQTVPLPEIDADDVIVKINASGVCRSDWHFWNGDWEMQVPIVLGHEIGGTVVAVGSGVKQTKVGDRVSIPFNLACGHCPYCHHGEQNLCDNMITPILTKGGGGWAEYSRVPNADLNCIKLPDEVDELSAAALGCRYMTAWHGVRDRAALKAGETVVVMGCGGVGLAAIEICVALGGRVIAVDISDDKLAYARSLGASGTVNARSLNEIQVAETIKELSGGRGPHLAVDALGGSRTSLPALLSLRKGGRILQIGLTGSEDNGKINFPVDHLVLNELSLVGSLGNPHSSFPDLLGLVAAKRLKPSALVTRKIGLEDVNSVLNEMSGFNTSGYVVIAA